MVSLLADDGVLVVFGAMASPTLEIGSGDVIFKQAVIKGFWGSKVFAAMSREKRASLMGELVAGHRLRRADPAGGAGLRPRGHRRGCAGQPGTGAARQDPAAPLRRPTGGPHRTTATGQVARCRTVWLTEPSSSPLK